MTVNSFRVIRLISLTACIRSVKGATVGCGQRCFLIQWNRAAGILTLSELSVALDAGEGRLEVTGNRETNCNSKTLLPQMTADVRG